MEVSTNDCFDICLSCFQKGEFFLNNSKVHKICRSCLKIKYSSVLRCLHCTSFVIFPFENYNYILDTVTYEENNFQDSFKEDKIMQNLENNKEKEIISINIVPLQSNPDQERTLNHSIPNINLYEEKDSSIKFNEVQQKSKKDDPSSNFIKIPSPSDDSIQSLCDICNKVFNIELYSYDCHHKICLGCIKQGRCIKCDSFKLMCTICNEMGAFKLNCGHIVCKCCTRNYYNCLNCHKEIIQSFCSFCSSPSIITSFPECSHIGCQRCCKNEYCYDKNCVKKNFGKKQACKKVCVFCHQYYLNFLNLLCDHAVCESCFNPDINVSKFVCWECVENINHLKCDKCERTIVWEQITEKIMYKACCKKSYCKKCYSICIDEHKCKSRFFSFLSFS